MASIFFQKTGWFLLRRLTNKACAIWLPIARSTERKFPLEQQRPCKVQKSWLLAWVLFLSGPASLFLRKWLERLVVVLIELSARHFLSRRRNSYSWFKSRFIKCLYWRIQLKVKRLKRIFRIWNLLGRAPMQQILSIKTCLNWREFTGSARNMALISIKWWPSGTRTMT